jgi:hypothetical protein
MVIIVKKLVPVFKKTDLVPKRWHNLRKAVYVTSFKHNYSNMASILEKEYGLNPGEKIVVFWMKEVPKPGWPRYRLPFKKVYSGPMKDILNSAPNFDGKRELDS